MKSVIIKMGASRFDVIVKGADGKPVTFDLYRMSKDQRRDFYRTFMRAYRAA